MIVFFLGCDVTLTEIAVSGDTKTTVERGTLVEDLLGDLGFSDFVSMDLTAAEELQNQNVKPGDISSAVLTDFGLEAVSGASDLSFIETMDLLVEAASLPELRIAFATAFPEGEATVDFQTTGSDITSYVTSQALTLSTDMSGHRPDEDTVVRAYWTVTVGVTTQGAVSNLDR
ncbi:hypothetical protein LBMAG42_20230 [Deltaproteobacteria bacterium]|nr:hypothetical protein LBMAG42_20230 [Deltaproteobacteria bacterium]